MWWEGRKNKLSHMTGRVRLITQEYICGINKFYFILHCIYGERSWAVHAICGRRVVHRGRGTLALRGGFPFVGGGRPSWALGRQTWWGHCVHGTSPYHILS